jgi:hypothetical protein
MAWDAPWDFGSVTRELYLFSFFDIVYLVFEMFNLLMWSPEFG